MPSLYEVLGLLLILVAIWFLLKVARVMIRLFLFLLVLAAVGAMVYWFFLR